MEPDERFLQKTVWWIMITYETVVLANGLLLSAGGVFLLLEQFVRHRHHEFRTRYNSLFVIIGLPMLLLSLAWLVMIVFYSAQIPTPPPSGSYRNEREIKYFIPFLAAMAFFLAGCGGTCEKK